ncbi:hypothetical protein MN116_008191 [Schistosoma mekongi]|uniref:Uncharacterized protein n=1 Tax=Schistosoma mekongi TaxID=38744 RepID=A0AAE2D1S0_SCHME|nr:hypothetical protein MN116_008191 [Schistosoma mekongi]
MTVKPSRCLFQSLENKSFHKLYDGDHDNNKNNSSNTITTTTTSSSTTATNKSTINKQCQQTFQLVCQRNLEKFCLKYNLDWNFIKSIDHINCNIQENDQENQHHQHSQHQHTIHKQTWHWEQLDNTLHYIPTFYLSTRYHSDSYLLRSHQHRYPVPPNTPHKSIIKHNLINVENSSQLFTPQKSSPLTYTSQTSSPYPSRSRNLNNYTESTSRRTSKCLRNEHVRSKSENKSDRIQNAHFDECSQSRSCIRTTCCLPATQNKSPNHSFSTPYLNEMNYIDKCTNNSHSQKESFPCTLISRRLNLKQLKLTG